MAVAVLAAAIFFISYDFFFYYNHLILSNVFAKQGIVTLLAFFISALISGRLANRLEKKFLNARS